MLGKSNATFLHLQNTFTNGDRLIVFLSHALGFTVVLLLTSCTTDIKTKIFSHI